jgi:hypothetical protein
MTNLAVQLENIGKTQDPVKRVQEVTTVRVKATTGELNILDAPGVLTPSNRPHLALFALRVIIAQKVQAR